MTQSLAERLTPLVQLLYPSDPDGVLSALLELAEAWRPRLTGGRGCLPDERTRYLITYPDTLRRPDQHALDTLAEVLETALADLVTDIHLLPTVHPWSSDDGFAVIEPRQIEPSAGDDDDIAHLARTHRLALDLVANHTSASSPWFSGWLAGEERYRGYYLTEEEGLDVSQVVRPRTTPLFHPFARPDGSQARVWTTFSGDQVDLDVRTPKVLLELTDILLGYVAQGATTVRLDAIGFLWKESGTTCLHLPRTHAVVQLWRALVDDVAPGTLLLTETNVREKDNLSYLGNGHNEAHMIYNFAMPPLVLHAFVTGDTGQLANHARRLGSRPNGGTWFNFLACHDGIGMRPLTGILPEEEQQLLCDHVVAVGGLLSRAARPDGTTRVYELNISYGDALCTPEELTDEEIWAAKLLAAHAIMLSQAGVPAIYLHSLLASTSDHVGAAQTGIPRRINREVLDADELLAELVSEPRRRIVLEGMRQLLQTRAACPELHPDAAQQVLDVDSAVFALARTAPGGSQLTCLANVSADPVEVPGVRGREVLSGREITGSLTLRAYGYAWVRS